MADPDSFDDVLANVVEVRVSQHQANAATRGAQQVSDALAATLFPARRAEKLLSAAAPLWLMSAPPEVLAGDLALCHPKLERTEVRAVARQVDGSHVMRLTVAARDRRGLLADTTAVLARHGLCITDASATTWSKPRLALHALTIENATDISADGWKRLGKDLRSIGSGGENVHDDFIPLGHATVTAYGDEAEQTLVRVQAPDQVGLLSSICRWFANQELSVESVHATTDGNIASDVFLINGTCNAAALQLHLGGN
jgi:UTP:GlnB (protein PII) uridylyltransferase